MINILLIVIAYLLGGIPFGLIVARQYGVADIRAHGSGNIGATNVWRVAGAKAAGWVFLGDIAKGAIAVMLSRLYLSIQPQPLVAADIVFVLCACAAVLGHVFPIYTRFRGGKGVNTGLGVMLALLPVQTLLAVLVFGIVLAWTKYVSLGSIVGVVALSVVLSVERFWLGHGVAIIFVYLSWLLTVAIVFTHRQNISRLLSGTENRFSISSSRSGEGSHA
ncbi:MAG: glycerol-3-phosphate 1-O-acyltransferase PlsY [Candidatus Zixiibacteriota bacterium]